MRIAKRLQLNASPDFNESRGGHSGIFQTAMDNPLRIGIITFV